MTEFLDACYRAIKVQETSISNTIDAVDDRGVEVLRDRRLIVLTGCGDSFAVAEYGKWAFLAVGLNAISVSPPEIQHIRLGEDSVVVGISATGRSLATIDALKLAKSNLARTIVLTDNANGRAVKYADQTWLTRSGVVAHNISPSSVTTTAMAYLLKLAVNYQETLNSNMHHDLQQLRIIGKQIIDWAEKAGQKLSYIANPNKPLYLISNGPNFVSAQIGMMKFNEYSIVKGVTALWEDFRHHNVLSINDGDSAVLISDIPVSDVDKKYFKALKETLNMDAYHLYIDENLKLQSALGQVIPNSIALQLAAYYNVMKYDSEKTYWKKPNVNAFKIY